MCHVKRLKRVAQHLSILSGRRSQSWQSTCRHSGRSASVPHRVELFPPVARVDLSGPPVDVQVFTVIAGIDFISQASQRTHQTFFSYCFVYSWIVLSCCSKYDPRINTKRARFARLLPQVFVEPVESTRPRQFGSGFVVTRRRIVVEAVLFALVHV